MSNLFRPVYYAINNIGVSILEQFQNYTLFPVSLKSFSWASFGYASFIVFLIGWLVYKHGRLYCNTVCPVGTLLGFISRFQFSKYRFTRVYVQVVEFVAPIAKPNVLIQKTNPLISRDASAAWIV
ncbi:MAG: 4Fe-4S binding protein [Bacteroidales bacterium]